MGSSWLDDGHFGGIAGTGQGAFGDQRLADAPGNRRGHLGVAQIQRRRFQRRFGGKHVRRALQRAGFGVFVGLLADAVDFDERLVAFGLGLRLLQCRLGLGEIGLRAVITGLQRRGINFKQHLIALHVRSFLEQPLHQNARGAGPHFGHPHGVDAPRQFGGDGHRFGSHDHDANFGRRHSARPAARPQARLASRARSR